MPTKTYLKDLTYQVNGAAIEVHKALGPGLLENVYHKCLKHELQLRGIIFQSEMLVPVLYKGVNVQADLRCDLFVENCLVVELKAVDAVLPLFEAQLMTYMKLLKAPLGLLINFNATHIFSQGQKTYVNEYYRELADK
ncbi:GxxExxY protein [Runella sp. SP2]|uniref:GxxExxY protein n=1 Tax=Runella sp. SP2 TaxID=2268026 RepID=UPI000F08E16C|nr:GxxExxY protein [Runella sp. SP2]AYQ34641.1 GxxExxY protein [Runella sp. SP2]